MLSFRATGHAHVMKLTSVIRPASTGFEMCVGGRGAEAIHDISSSHAAHKKLDKVLPKFDRT
jgi:hypothetical protein